MKDLINDKDKRISMGRNNYSYVYKEYNIDSYVSEWEKVYTKLI